MNLTYLRTYSVESQPVFWGRGHDATSWSSDNQVALVHKKGVNVYDCRQTPGIQKRPPVLTIFPSRIDVSQTIHVPNTGNITSTEIMRDEDKQHIFDLMRDHILRPHGYDTTLFHNYVLKALWSPVPIYRGREVENRCILGVLTSTHQLLIYGQRCRRFTSELWTEPWEIILDITDVYNRYMCDVWINKDSTNKKFDTYKQRLYEIAIIDFIWIPDWKLDPDAKYTDEMKGVFKSYFITFHASGDSCIWKMVASKTLTPKYSVSVVYRKTSLMGIDDIVSSTTYSYVSSNFGLLLLGTNNGKIMSFVVEKGKAKSGKPVKQEQDAAQQIGYTIGNEQCLWEEDMIRVEHLMLCPISSGRRKLDIIAVKNPNILIATTVSITSFRISGNEFSIVKVPYGPIVGIKMRQDKEFLVTHEPGQLSLVSFINGELECVENSSTSIFDPQKTSKKKAILIGEAVQKLERKERKVKQLKDSDKRLIFQGLALSPNKTLLCIARTVGMYYDHLQIRKPTQLVFYSLLPQEGMFDMVRELYAKNSFSLRGIVDVLVPFRFALRGKLSEILCAEISSWVEPLEEKSMQELQLLLWCLRVFPKSDPAEWEVASAERQFNPEAVKTLVGIDALHKYRIEVVADRILQKRCESLVRAVLQNQDRNEFSLNVEINKQCLQALFEFLKSKNVSLPQKPVFNSFPHIPMCYWCKGPLEFPLEMFSFDEDLKDIDTSLQTYLDREKWSGFKWDVRRHPVKEFGVHKPEICILTLLPLQFPYRRCRNCFVPALMEPAFGQLPYCPLCNAVMYPNQVLTNVPNSSDTSPTPHTFSGIQAKTEPPEMEPLDDWFSQTQDVGPDLLSESESNEYVSDSSDC